MARLALLNLKSAIVRTGNQQWLIAKRSRITIFRLSKIVNGHYMATEDERAAITRIVRTLLKDETLTTVHLFTGTPVKPKRASVS